LVGKQIEYAYVYWLQIVDTDAEKFIKEIKNQSIKRIDRRGKYLVFTLSRDTLLVHLRMTGKFELINENAPVKKHEHLRLVFSDGVGLCYEDPRKFGRISLLRDPKEKINRLGIEPLSNKFTLPVFQDLILKHSTQIKPFLLNQKYIVGLGNIYVDEALWEAKIHPKRLTHTLTFYETKALHQAIRHVLNKGIENQGTSLGTGQANYYSVSGRRGSHQHYLHVFRQDGTACSRCGSLIIKTIVAQRGTHLCPKCQKM